MRSSVLPATSDAVVPSPVDRVPGQGLPAPRTAAAARSSRSRRELGSTRRGLSRHRRRVLAVRGAWGLALLGVFVIPLALSAEAGGRSDLLGELSLTSGLLALSALVAAIVLPSRIRSLTTAFGIERVLRSHRWMGLTAAVLVLVHIVFVLAHRPSDVHLFYLPTAPPRARAATVATVAILLLCGLSVLRRRLGTRYEVWRGVHLALVALAIGGSALHLFWLDHLVRDPAMRWCFMVTGAVVAAVLAGRWIGKPLVAARNAFVVNEIRSVTPQVTSLVLAPRRRRAPGLRFRPGQFAWLRLDHPWGPLEYHPFTIVSGAHERRRLEFRVRHVGDFTTTVRNLTRGRRVYVDGPYGSFNDDHERAAALILVAGGVGITPMISILRTLAARGDTRPVCLLVGARTADELMFHEECRRLQQDLALEVIEVLSSPPPGWPGVTGRIDQGLIAAVLSGRRRYVGAHAFICGPPAMTRDVRAALLGRGLPAERIHTEQFELV